jgi:MFS family permease
VPARTRLHSLVPEFRDLPRPFWVLFAGTFVNRVGGFVLIFLAIYLTEARRLTPAQAGAVIAAYGIGAIGAGPIGGALADRIGRRPTLVASLIGGGVSMFVLGLMTHTTTITAVAIATGLLYEMYRPVVSATVADIVSAEARPRACGLMYWAVNLSASVAALLGGVLAAHSYRVLFAVDAITTAMFGVVLWAALPETRPAAPADDSADSGAVHAILHDRLFLTVCLLTLGFCLVFFQAFVGLPIDMRAHGISTSEFGGLMAINGILIVVLQPFVGELIRDRSRPLVLALASLVLGVGFGLNAWMGTRWVTRGDRCLDTRRDPVCAGIDVARSGSGTGALTRPVSRRVRRRVHGRIRRRTGSGWVRHCPRRCPLSLDRLLRDRRRRRNGILHAETCRLSNAVSALPCDVSIRASRTSLETACPGRRLAASATSS